MRGASIESTIVGGPAYSSQLFARGDVILQVDNQTAHDKNVSLLVVGDDVPGSTVNLTVAKDGDMVRTLPLPVCGIFMDKVCRAPLCKSP